MGKQIQLHEKDQKHFLKKKKKGKQKLKPSSHFNIPLHSLDAPDRFTAI